MILAAVYLGFIAYCLLRGLLVGTRHETIFGKSRCFFDLPVEKGETAWPKS